MEKTINVNENRKGEREESSSPETRDFYYKPYMNYDLSNDSRFAGQVNIVNNNSVYLCYNGKEEEVKGEEIVKNSTFLDNQPTVSGLVVFTPNIPGVLDYRNKTVVASVDIYDIVMTGTITVEKRKEQAKGKILSLKSGGATVHAVSYFPPIINS